MRISGYYRESINEGDGLRAVVFISGCRHACKGCFNRKAWDFNAGDEFTDERQGEIIEDLAKNPMLDGLTLCGGDPFFSAQGCAEFVRRFRERCPDRTVWAYTGFTFEALLHHQERRGLLELCDVLIDGRFVEEQKDTTLRFRGSRNQRVIDVQASISAGEVVTLDAY